MTGMEEECDRTKSKFQISDDGAFICVKLFFGHCPSSELQNYKMTTFRKLDPASVSMQNVVIYIL
jgi:hypothetical protein